MSTSVVIEPMNPVASAPSYSLWSQFRSAWSEPESRRAIIGSLVSLVILGLLFRGNLRHFVDLWSTDPNYSHGFLVPLLALYFADAAARRGPIPYLRGHWIGLGLLSMALVGRFVTTLIPVGFVGDLSFLLGLSGIIALGAGRGALTRFSFALLFLVFMVPLPIHLYTLLASPLQLKVSEVSAVILDGTGLPVLREGNRLTLPGGVEMFVAEACSGMRQLTGFLALTTAVAYLSGRPLWYRLILVVSSIPIALTANIGRVVLTGRLMAVDPELAQGTFHTLEGLLLMGFGLGLLKLECLVLDMIVTLPHSRSRSIPKPA